jgi:Spy/CpxP family protein refolding chaperone
LRRDAWLLAAAAILTASSAAAQGVLDGKWWKRPRIANELKLTTEQTAELEKIFARSKPKLIDLRADFEKKRFEYEQAMEDEKVDRELVAEKIEAREQARARMQKELALMELDMKQVLTVEQRQKLAAIRERLQEAVQERRRKMRETDQADPPRRERR